MPKVIKVEKCQECPYPRNGGGYRRCGLDINDENIVLHPSCPLPDWPEVDKKEAVKKWADGWSFGQFSDWLSSIGVIIREREEEKDGI